MIHSNTKTNILCAPPKIKPIVPDFTLLLNFFIKFKVKHSQGHVHWSYRGHNMYKFTAPMDLTSPLLMLMYGTTEIGFLHNSHRTETELNQLRSEILSRNTRYTLVSVTRLRARLIFGQISHWKDCVFFLENVIYFIRYIILKEDHLIYLFTKKGSLLTFKRGLGIVSGLNEGNINCILPKTRRPQLQWAKLIIYKLVSLFQV